MSSVTDEQRLEMYRQVLRAAAAALAVERPVTPERVCAVYKDMRDMPLIDDRYIKEILKKLAAWGYLRRSANVLRGVKKARYSYSTTAYTVPAIKQGVSDPHSECKRIR